MKLFHDVRRIKGLPIENMDFLREVQGAVENSMLIESEKITIFFTTANIEQRINLNKLNKTPLGYFVVKKDKACDIFTGTTAWGKNIIFLKSSVSNVTVTLMVI